MGAEIEGGMPELFRSVMGRAPPNTPAKAPPAPAAPVASALGVIQAAKTKVYDLLPVPVREWVQFAGGWWGDERLGRVVEGSLPRRGVDVLAIGVLANLCAASLTEDRYGAVQRDIPRVLEAFLSFLSAVEAYQVEVAGHALPSAEELKGMSGLEREAKAREAEEVRRAGEALGLVADALKDGVALIARTFGDKLLAFKFPPRVARKLQGFVDYN